MQPSEITEIILSDVALLTCDRINALKGGHGGLPFAFLGAANTIVEALLAGRESRIENANAPHIPLDDLVEQCVSAGIAGGATPSNAALIAALLLYFSGTQSRAGVPAANRKLGAMARLHAGVERGGVANMPTPKMGNKISGFPAVEALYRAMMRKRLTRVDGGLLPLGSTSGTPWGHSALGEDIVIPDVAFNGARVATRAMKRAYAGIGLAPSPIFSAIFGAAAVAEVIHPDAAVDEKYGPYGKADSIYLVGLGASREAGLVKELHIPGTEITLDTARVVGDLGLILKDVGAPTVVGMIGFYDLMSSFVESDFIMPNAIGTVNPPMAHVPISYLLTAMGLLLQDGSDAASAGARLREARMWKSLDAETSLACMYIMTRKGAELSAGPVTDALLAACEEPVREAVARRIESTTQAFAAGRELADVVRALDDERKAVVEEKAGLIFSAMTGQEIKIRFTAVRPQGRRTDPFTRRYLGFDGCFDVEASVDGKVETISNVFAEALPRVMRGGLNRLKRRMMAGMGQAMARRGKVPNIIPGQEWLIPHMLDIPLTVAIVASQELTYASNCLLNVVVPAAVAVAEGKHEPEEAARIAEGAAYITATIPGAVARARKVGEMVAGTES
ncbi:MAG: hypothetical protein JW854_10545 [Actinobacteria bacterium]|nr:hypothetical protein [Actinomycetota bacterium]